MKLITLNFPVADFVNNAQILSQYRTQTTYNAGGDAVTDNTRLTSDDEVLITKYLKTACASIAEALMAYTKYMYADDGVTMLEAYEFNVTYGELSNQIVFRINMPDTFMDTILSSMDDSIRDALESYILYRSSKVRGTEFQSYLEDWTNGLKNVKSYLHRRSVPIVRSMNAF